MPAPEAPKSGLSGNGMSADTEDLLLSVWLYIKWRYVTENLTTKQRNMFADAIDASSYRMAVEDGTAEEWQPVADRWWQDDKPPHPRQSTPTKE